MSDLHEIDGHFCDEDGVIISEEPSSEEKDFGFYGEEAEKEEIKDLDGVTNSVTQFVLSNMNFPSLCLRENIILPRHKWVIISKLVKQNADEKDISLYFNRNGELYKAGSISGIQVKALVDIIGLDNLVGYYNKDKQLVGDKIYVLAS